MRLVLISVVLLLTLAACHSPGLVITAAPLPTVTPPLPTATPGPLHVHVDGAVRQPGDYTLPPGSLLDDAVRAAGGLADDADLEQLNLALDLYDGQHLHVPRPGEVLPTPTPHGLSADGRIDINRADAALLQTLPKVGPTTAQRIIEYRETQGPFETIEQIQEVKGIGPATFEGIKDLIVVDEVP
jgi:competence protein ComEA